MTEDIHLDVHVPEWVRYLAQDKNGWWYGYEQVPLPCAQFPGNWINEILTRHIQLAHTKVIPNADKLIIDLNEVDYS